MPRGFHCDQVQPWGYGILQQLPLHGFTSSIIHSWVTAVQIHSPSLPRASASQQLSHVLHLPPWSQVLYNTVLSNHVEHTGSEVTLVVHPVSSTWKSYWFWHSSPNDVLKVHTVRGSGKALQLHVHGVLLLGLWWWLIYTFISSAQYQ